jgi:hypothetical protein
MSQAAVPAPAIRSTIEAKRIVEPQEKYEFQSATRGCESDRG